MAGASLVHITCHGVFDPENPQETGLVLPDGRGDVSLLTLRDLSKQRFAHLRLTTLVSCWSADAYVRPGRWVVSAPETLCRAGAESVIAALWEVDNVRVAPFLRLLYHHLKTQPCDKALRLAQLEASETLLPYVWAAFQLHGSRERIRWKGLR
jgi:CHAT domain-containing protein